MLSYRPSSGYYRRAVRAAALARDVTRLLDLALALVRETEYLRTWARANGLEPIHVEVPLDEARERHAVYLERGAAFKRSHILASGHSLASQEAQGQR